MPPAADRVRAVGRLSPGGPWIGFAETPSGYRLVAVVGDGPAHELGGGSLAADRAGLLAMAIAHFLGSLEPPPPEIEATQADIARLVRSFGSTPADGAPSGVLHEALDAIDDGLPGDAVARRLAALLPDPAADPVTILAERLAADRRT